MKNKNNLIILGIAVFVILLSFFFLWGEEIIPAKKINDQKFSNYFTIIGSLATAASLLILYRQIKEMQEDRKASNKPDLYPENTYYQIDLMDSLQDTKLYDILPRRKVQKVEGRFDRYIIIHNIGLGTAKEVEFIWKFDKEVIISIIKGKFYYNDEQLPKPQRFNFILANNSIQIEPPYFFLKCCAVSFNRKETFFDYELHDTSNSEKPKLHLIITCKDIYNHTVSKVFQVSIHTSFSDVAFLFKEVNGIGI